MQKSFLTCAVSVILAATPVFALAQSTTNVNPTNSLSVNPTTNQAATTSNVSTQINNQNLGANSYGNGISCQSAQVALGGYGGRQTSGVGLNNADTGFSVQYLAPLNGNANKTCASLSQEVLLSRQIDNATTMIQKCTDFARAGVVLDPAIYPDLSRACSGVRVTNFQQSAPPQAPVGVSRTRGLAASR